MTDYKLVPMPPTREMVEAAADAYMPLGDMDLAIRMAVLVAPDVQGEPVAWMDEDGCLHTTLESARLRGMTAVLQFLEKADDLISVYPFLYVEIARTRVTDWMAWLRTKPKEGEGKTLAVGQGLTPDEACEAALAELEKKQ